MNSPISRIFTFASSCLLIMASSAVAQVLPGSLSFSTAGTFGNGVGESSSSILIADNNLTNGYTAGFDLTDAPTALSPNGPAGSAAYQWGEGASWMPYPHPSAMWFQPLAATAVTPEESFDLGYLFYRNGTIKSNSGSSWVDIALTLAFSQPLGIDPVHAVFGQELINTLNSSDQVASADIVRLGNLAEPLNFTDTYGNRYYLELTFQIDQDTIDGTLSTQDEFRVFEGQTGRAVLLGRFTTTPVGMDINLIPEPSTALLGLLGAALMFRRKR